MLLKRNVVAFSCVLLAGCAQMSPQPTPQSMSPAAPIAQPVVLENTGQNTAPEELDVVSIQERESALATVEPDTLKKLGTVVGSLGNPAEVGFWVKTAYVSEPKAGQITSLTTGESVNVDLFPRSGGVDAAEVSLSALRAINAPLAGLSKFDLFIRR